MWSLPASVLAGFGYYLLHATLQTNATQMVPSARGTAVAWFASCLFMGQAAGVALAGAVVDEIGAAALFGGSAVMLPVLGAGFAWALKRRAAGHGLRRRRACRPRVSVFPVEQGVEHGVGRIGQYRGDAQIRRQRRFQFGTPGARQSVSLQHGLGALGQAATAGESSRSTMSSAGR